MHRLFSEVGLFVVETSLVEIFARNNRIRLPVAGGAPVVFDMATSVVARGNVLQAISDGASIIPDGWAIGPDGKITTDPAQAFKGAMLPISGHNGVGAAHLALAFENAWDGPLGGAVVTRYGYAAKCNSCSHLYLVSKFVMAFMPSLLILMVSTAVRTMPAPSSKTFKSE